MEVPLPASLPGTGPRPGTSPAAPDIGQLPGAKLVARTRCSAEGNSPRCSRREQSFAQDVASLVAMVTFLASIAVVLAGIFNAGAPV